MTLEPLHAVLASVADARPGGAIPIYELRSGLFFFSRRSRTLADRQARAFAALRDVGWPVFVTGDLDDPRELATGGSWVKSAADTWLLPPEAKGGVLLARWLHVGGYRVYLAREPIDPGALPDLFRAPPADALASAMEHGVAALLDSFLDDWEWRILVQPSVVAEAMAA